MNKLKTTLMILVVLVCHSVSGQTFGIKGGLNLSNLLNKDNDFKYSEEYKLKPGFNLGVSMEMPVSGAVSFETGLILDSKGYKRNYMVNTTDHEVTVNSIYLNIPLHFKFSTQMGNLNPYFLAGPYLGIGISGKISNKSINSGISSTQSYAINWGNDNNSDFKQVDGGLDFGAGLDFGNISFGATFGLGLVNICPLPSNGQVYNNRVLSISVGYKFSK